MRRVSSGQGSLEYLLLLGAGSLVALIVFLLLIFLGPYGGGLFDQNLQEYEKIDLCSGSDNAACSLHLNWNDGLLTAPNGFILEDTTWRTLQLDGIGFKIFCKNGICDGGSFYGGQGPIITLEFPVTPAGGVCDPATENCVTLPLNMCESETSDDGSGPVVKLTGPCSTEFDFSDLDALPSSFIDDATFQLSPAEPKKEVVIVSVGNLNHKDLVSVQIFMKVSQVAPDGTTVKEGWDTDADKLSWYSTSPFLLGSSFQCENLGNPAPSTPYVQFGCIFPPNCSPLICPAPSTSPISGSIDEACQSLGVPEGEFVCSVGDSYESAFCVNVSGVDSFFTHSTGPNKKGPFISMDIAPIKGAVFLQNFAPVFSVGVNGFDVQYKSSCGTTPDVTCGQALCNGYTSELANLEFYVLNPSAPIADPLMACALMTDASIASPNVLNLDVNPFPGGPKMGFLDLDPNPDDDVEDWFYTCSQPYDFYTQKFKDNILNAPASPDVMFVGIRYPNPPSSAFTLNSVSPFSSTFASIGMSAFYYSP